MNAGVRLTLVALATVILISLIAWFTKKPIERANEQWIRKSLNEIIPTELHDSQTAIEAFDFHHTALGSNELLKIYPIIRNSEWMGSVITAVAPDGYSGKIHLLIAIDRYHSLWGVRVIEHKETPGLGDDIEIRKSAWITSFDDVSLHSLTDAQWAVKKDGGIFDQFTGATITPRAVINTVYRVLSWHEREGLILLKRHYQSQTDIAEASELEKSHP